MKIKRGLERKATSTGQPILKPDEKPVPLKSPASPPFQYFGGKTRLRNKIVSNMPPHKTFVEVMAGGASVLLAKPPSEVEVLNDKNPSIMKVHKAAKRRAEKWNLSPSRRRWEKIKRKSPSARSGEEQAFFLDHSWNGLGHTYTEKGKSGEFDTEKLHARMKDAIMLQGRDFAEVMKMFDSQTALIYIDPPYYYKGKDGKVHENDLYETKGVSAERVAEVAAKAKGKVMISYDDSKPVREAFKGRPFRIHRLAHTYGAETGSKPVKELLITNYDVGKLRANAKPFDEKKAKKEVS